MAKKSKPVGDKVTRGNASQFFVAGELARRGIIAALTLGNCPNTDILCSSVDGRKFVHIQVKTFVPEGRTCSVGMNAEINYGPNFFWILSGLPRANSLKPFTYYMIPSSIMARNVKKGHEIWLKTPGMKGQPHNDNKIRAVHIPPYRGKSGWSIKKYENAWNLIENRLKS